MKTFIKNLITSLGLLSLLAAPALAVGGPVYAQSAKDSVEKGVCATYPDGKCPDTDAASSVDGLVADIITILSWIVGVVAVIAIIIGGFRYVTSGGDSAKINGAKNTILYAIVGLIIVAVSQLIVIFVLGRL